MSFVSANFKTRLSDIAFLIKCNVDLKKKRVHCDLCMTLIIPIMIYHFFHFPRRKHAANDCWRSSKSHKATLNFNNSILFNSFKLLCS